MGKITPVSIPEGFNHRRNNDRIRDYNPKNTNNVGSRYSPIDKKISSEHFDVGYLTLEDAAEQIIQTNYKGNGNGCNKKSMMS
jgi:hypothetical protein